MKRVALLIGLVLVVAACGGSKSEEDQIKQNWVTFFSAKTSTDQKVELLQDGERFRSAIAILENNALAAELNAKVSSVTLEGKNKAKVVFTIYLGNTAVQNDQVGQAFKQNGKWLVGYAGLCKLIALQGTTPAACTTPTS
jgi:hypothetical protein